jgi:antitoxin component of MazEF toxin-antitoxin module
MSQVRLNNNRSMKLRRVIEFGNSTSLGLVVPSNFVHKMGLSAGQYIKCELDNEGNSFTVERIVD